VGDDAGWIGIHSYFTLVPFILALRCPGRVLQTQIKHPMPGTKRKNLIYLFDYSCRILDMSAFALISLSLCRIRQRSVLTLVSATNTDIDTNLIFSSLSRSPPSMQHQLCLSAALPEEDISHPVLTINRSLPDLALLQNSFHLVTRQTQRKLAWIE
jgi:hypothetical protein